MKTTTALNLAYALSEKGNKVLLIDLDTQGNLTMCFRIDRPDELKTTIYDLMMCIIDEKELPADSNSICFDTHDLQNTSDNVKRTQYFNILTWCWEQMSRNRTERVLLIADEAYLMIDPHMPQSLVFLRNVAKRARKYEAGIAIISHSVVDFLDDSIRMYGQALLDIPCFKI